MNKILIIDDEEHIIDVIAAILKHDNYDIHSATDGESGLDLIKKEDPDIIICDMKMKQMTGLDVLKKTKEFGASGSFIIATAYGSVENAVECMKNGAFHYIVKPFNKDELRLLVQRALLHKKLLLENISLKEQLSDKYSFENIIGKSNAMQKVYELMDKVSRSDTTVLIYGESGTGKELVAKAIQYRSARRNKPFVAINCGGLPEGLLESELFGHVKGSFTGAISDKEGLFKAADGGTLFLDEISATTPAIQVKLLRVLQERLVKRVGDTKEIPVDVKIIVATNKKLDEEVKDGRFREDLYYRISVIPIFLPSLKERTDDIPLIVQHFLNKYHKDVKEKEKTVTYEAMNILMQYEWPGNVRELENVIERAVILSEGDVIKPDDLPDDMLKSIPAGFVSASESFRLKDIMRKKEKDYILDTISKTSGDKKAAAEMLGIDLATLYRKLQE